MFACLLPVVIQPVLVLEHVSYRIFKLVLILAHASSTLQWTVTNHDDEFLNPMEAEPLHVVLQCG